MMNEEQYLLSKLAEEGAEVAQMASKCNIFGLDEVYENPDGTRLSNKTRLSMEVFDLLAIVKMLDDRGLLDGAEADIPDDYCEQKLLKVKKYMEISRKLGRLE